MILFSFFSDLRDRKPASLTRVPLMFSISSSVKPRMYSTLVSLTFVPPTCSCCNCGMLLKCISPESVTKVPFISNRVRLLISLIRFIASSVILRLSLSRSSSNKGSLLIKSKLLLVIFSPFRQVLEALNFFQVAQSRICDRGEIETDDRDVGKSLPVNARKPCVRHLGAILDHP
ncbi:hypothetical protein Pla52n_28680 [Stieleria varia]|uniref:Uncharacterized protein n=1 Tax=Stieleria varia TaxID=2528005 RepID=A0A5C6B2Z7_9BACT|nr:hypothetical protein Pla52n_28680 [Stieleria varia]